jgi:uncharacterized membrane protein YecN with MAPEG domain
MSQIWQYVFALRRVNDATDLGRAGVFPLRKWDIFEEGLIIVDGRVCGAAGVIDTVAYKIQSRTKRYLSTFIFLFLLTVGQNEHKVK